MSEHHKVLAALGLGSLAIGFAAIFFRLAAPTDPLLASMLRLAIAGALLAPVSVHAMRDGTLSPRAVKVALGCGVAYALHFGTWVASLERTSVAASVTLVTATPLMLAVVAFARGRDRPSLRTALAIGAATCGVLLIGASDLTGAPGAVVGDLLALVGAAAMVVYLLAVRELGAREERPVPAFAFSGVAALAGALTLGLSLPIEAALMGPLALPTANALFFIALAALVPQVVGHGLLTWALRRASPTEVGLATAAESVLSTGLAVIVFAEHPTALVLVGAAITLSAVVVGITGSRAGAPAR